MSNPSSSLGNLYSPAWINGFSNFLLFLEALPASLAPILFVSVSAVQLPSLFFLSPPGPSSFQFSSSPLVPPGFQVSASSLVSPGSKSSSPPNPKYPLSPMDCPASHSLLLYRLQSSSSAISLPQLLGSTLGFSVVSSPLV